jgi:glycosyltransferase involved in cell wall biosynthesis
MKNYFSDLNRTTGVRIRSNHKRIYFENPYYNLRNTNRKEGIKVDWQSGLRILPKFRLRHLKLGPRYLFRYFITQIRPSRTVLNLENSWDTRRITFTIALTVHNQTPRELMRCINSVLSQSRKAEFVHIFDDGSNSQRTLKTLKKIVSDNPKILLTKSKNQGVIRARNQLITSCKTSHLLFVDPDDELSPQYLEAAEKIFLGNRGIEIVYPHVKIRTSSEEKIWITGPFDANALQVINTIPMSSICAIEVFRDLKGFSVDFNQGFEDWDFWFRASLSGFLAAPLNEVGYYYSEKQVSRSSNAEKYRNQLTLRIQKRALGPVFPQDLNNQIEIFIFSPWYIRGGGVDALLARLLHHYAKKNVVLVTTEKKPENYTSAITPELRKSIPVIERNKIGSDEIFCTMLRDLASTNAVIINLSSPWAFENSTVLATFVKFHFAWAFNETGTFRILNCKGPLTEAWPVYTGLKDEIENPENIRIPAKLIFVGIQSTIKRRLSQPGAGKLSVGWLGRLSPEKDPIKYVAISKVSNPKKFKFSMAGEGPLQDKVLAELKQLKSVEYLGFVESSQTYLQKLDILVLTSKIEGIPLAAMEALQLGVYVIAPNVGGLPDLIKDKKNGLLYNGSKSDLLRALEEARSIIRSEQSFPKLSKEFSEEKMFELIDSRIKHYREISQTKLH